jgi:peptidyl-prolyl cis-trans isomerase A (cyclophilin A)
LKASAKMETLAGWKTESGLRYQFIQRGDGKQAEAGKKVYTEGSLETVKF